MKVLVTEASGFIGFYLVQRLIERDCQVVGIDSINDYYDINLKFGRLACLGILRDDILYNKEVKSKNHTNFTFYQLALEDEASLTELFEKESFEIVINLAAQAGVRYSLDNPHAYINSNVTGFLNILECSRKARIKHLVYASSSSVYGLNKEAVFSTSHPVDHPVSLYAATKRSNELMAHVYSSVYNLPVTGLRFFTVYGPWGRPDMAPMLFTKAILEGKPISVFNNGDLQRDFTYVEDIVEGITRLINRVPTRNSEEFNENPSPANSISPFAIYNIGNNSPVRLLDFIQVLEKELGIEAIKEFKPMQPGDVYSTFADVNPLAQDVGYRPSTTLEHGIKQFVKWYRSFYNIK